MSWRTGSRVWKWTSAAGLISVDKHNNAARTLINKMGWVYFCGVLQGSILSSSWFYMFSRFHQSRTSTTFIITKKNQKQVGSVLVLNHLTILAHVSASLQWSYFLNFLIKLKAVSDWLQPRESEHSFSPSGGTLSWCHKNICSCSCNSQHESLGTYLNMK